LGALLAGGVFASGLEGLGARVRSALRIPGLRTVDGLLGAALTACVGLGIAWIIGAVALDASSSRPLRTDIQDSTILRALNEILPPSGPILDALARVDPLSSVRGPAAAVPAPTTRGRPRAGPPGRPPPMSRRPRRACSPVRACRRRATAWCACSAPHAGWAWRAAAGWPHLTWWSPTPMSSPA